MSLESLLAKIMTPPLMIVGLTISLFTHSCSPTSKADEQAATQTSLKDTKSDNLVQTTVTNHEGVKLEMTFDNAKHTARFVLNGENIKLKQDTTASGIHYSNDHYEFREHQSEITLKKDGRTVFFYNK